jgi:hypothetical protein
MSRRCDITVPEVENPLFNFEILCYVPVHLELYGMWFYVDSGHTCSGTGTEGFFCNF